MASQVARTSPTGRSNAAAALLLGGVVGMLALPSAVLALSVGMTPAASAPAQKAGASGFQPAQFDPRLARSISVRALNQGQSFRFTLGAAPNRFDRSVTVAVRLDEATVGGRGVLGVAAAESPSSISISPTAYSLGVSRGSRGFAQNSGGGSEIRKMEMPDLATFTPTPGAKGDPSRFSPRIALDEHASSGRSPRTLQGQDQQTVDLGGSYRLTRNLNVTAGVRVSSDRDRLAPLSDGRKDNQAVYVGTQFKF